MNTTLSNLIESLSHLKLSKKQLELEAEDVAKSIAKVEDEIMKAMDAEGIVESKSAAGKVTLSESVVPQVEQWDVFAEFVLDTRALHLLERRPAILAYREMLSLGKPVPGILPFTKRKLAFKEA